MAYLEELLPEFRKGAKIRKNFWDEWFYVYFSRGIARNQNGGAFRFDGDDLASDSWEFYQEPEPDWQYIIDHKCLCWFWDDISTNVKEIGFLENIFDDEDGEYYASNGTPYNNCRPICRDEVTFYEDKKDGKN